jgi:hypothetical protein
VNGEPLALTLPDELVDAIVSRVLAQLPAQLADEWLDVKGAAAYLKCPPSRIYALVSAGSLPPHRDAHGCSSTATSCTAS